MNKDQHTLDKLLYDEEEGVMFNRFSGTGGNYLNLTGGTGAGSATSGTFTTGKYIVVKYRATGTTLGFNVATGDKKSGNGKSLGTQDITNLPGDEWRVAIIDASASEQWTSDGSAQTIYMMITTGAGEYVVDIAYVAVVDSLDEMRTLLQDGETYVDMGTNWAGTPVEYNYDGSQNLTFDENMSATVTVPAGATATYSVPFGLSEGMILTANGTPIDFVAGNRWMGTPSTFSITNDTEAAVEYALVASYPAGSQMNPAQLVIGDNTADVAAGAVEPYYFTWTAEKDGTLTLTVSSTTGWFYVVNNMTSYVYGDMQWSDSDPVVNPAVIEVKAGDVLEIQVNTYDPADQWNTPAGTVTVAAAFEEASTVITTIAGALAGEEGAAVKLTGTVVGFYETWSSYGNCSPYIVDAEGDQILVFRTTTQVGLGDEISVEGVITVYNKVNQIAQGSTVTITAPHVCSEWDEATCKAPKTCKVCGATEGEVADHVYVGGVCDVCGAAEGVELQKATVAYTGTTTTNMTGNNDAATLGLDASVFTVVGEKGSKDIFPGLNKSGQIRLYGSNGDGNALKVTVAEGYSISSIKITFGTSNKSNCQISAGDTVLTTTISSSEAVLSLDINADSFTLKNLNSGTTQIYILSIEITYFAE